MNDYEQALARFWAQASELELDCTSIALMLALLHVREERGFSSHCSVPNEWLDKLLHIDIRTMRTARKRLIDCGLIQFRPGRAQRQPEYWFEREQGEPQELPFKDGEGVQPEEVPNIPVEVVEEKAELRKPKPKPVRKRKPKTSDGAQSFFGEKDLVQPARKKKEQPKGYTLDDVLAQFRRRGLPDEDAERFFYYYDAQGWVTSAGQKIHRLDSMINRWLTNEHKTKANGNDRSNNKTSAERAADAMAVVTRLAARNKPVE